MVLGNKQINNNGLRTLSYFILSCLYCVLQGHIEFFVNFDGLSAYNLIWICLLCQIFNVSYRWLDVLFNTRRAFPLIFVSSCKVLRSWLRVVYVLLLRCSSDNPLVAEGPGAMNFWNIPPYLLKPFKVLPVKITALSNTSRPTSGNLQIHSEKIYSGAFL